MTDAEGSVGLAQASLSFAQCVTAGACPLAIPPAPLRGELPALASITITRSMARHPQSRLLGLWFDHDYRNSIFQQEGRLTKVLSHDIEE